MALFGGVVIFQRVISSLQLALLTCVLLFFAVTLNSSCRINSHRLPHSNLTWKSPVVMAILGCVVFGMVHNIGAFVVDRIHCKMGLQICAFGYPIAYFFVNAFLFIKQRSVNSSFTSTHLRRGLQGTMGVLTCIFPIISVIMPIVVDGDVYTDSHGEQLCIMRMPDYLVGIFGGFAVICGCGYFVLFVLPLIEVRRRAKERSADSIKLNAVIARNFRGFFVSTTAPIFVMLLMLLVSGAPPTERNLAALAICTNLTLVDHMISILAMIYAVWPSWHSSKPGEEPTNSLTSKRRKAKQQLQGNQQHLHHRSADTDLELATLGEETVSNNHSGGNSAPPSGRPSNPSDPSAAAVPHQGGLARLEYSKDHEIPNKAQENVNITTVN